MGIHLVNFGKVVARKVDHSVPEVFLEQKIFWGTCLVPHSIEADAVAEPTPFPNLAVMDINPGNPGKELWTLKSMLL